ncbi:DNA translocase FtsK [Bacillus mexicanus]|uniref:DNA translocase FtsK n=1 Tax=Bacillus mexicanus TaxID=2834415 RepID=UPI003D23DCFB
MSSVYFEIHSKTKAKYFFKDGTEIDKTNYIKTKIKEADEIYEKVVRKAKENGSVHCSWIQRVFGIDWYGSAHIIERMRDEGVCEQFHPDSLSSKIISYA